MQSIYHLPFTHRAGSSHWQTVHLLGLEYVAWLMKGSMIVRAPQLPLPQPVPDYKHKKSNRNYAYDVIPNGPTTTTTPLKLH